VTEKLQRKASGIAKISLRIVPQTLAPYCVSLLAGSFFCLSAPIFGWRCDPKITIPA
jgi:hypothetical protein